MADEGLQFTRGERHERTPSVDFIIATVEAPKKPQHTHTNPNIQNSYHGVAQRDTQQLFQLDKGRGTGTSTKQGAENLTRAVQGNTARGKARLQQQGGETFAQEAAGYTTVPGRWGHVAGKNRRDIHSKTPLLRATQCRRHSGRGGRDVGGGRAMVLAASRLWAVYTGHGEARASEAILLYTGGQCG